MGKLFVTVFASPRRGFRRKLLNFCSCTQDKFVMVVAPGHPTSLRYVVQSAHLHTIGWRVPSYKDWNKLAQFAGGLEKAGGKLKPMDGTLWEGSIYGFDHTYNFNALPGGYRRMDMSITRFQDRGSIGYWWTADSVDYIYSTGVLIKNSSLSLSKDKFKKQSALSIRCIKD